LRLDVGFATAASHANCVLITSPVERESKSTMLAEFAMVLARDGHDVIIVDLDMRRPTQHACFDISQRPGLYDVLTNNVSLDNALRYVPLRTRVSSHGGNGNTSENERSHMETAIRVLPAGTRGPAPGDLVSSDAIRRLLGRLREQCEFVLIDAPPLLLASDAAAISRSIDAIIVVTRVGSLRRPMIANLRWALDSCAADKLGVVVTGADPELRKSSSFSRFIQPQPS
jgi:Mrp family chromosome partitioning ATPase